MCLTNRELLRARMMIPYIFVEVWVFCELYCNSIYYKCFSLGWMPWKDKIQGITHWCHLWKVPELSRFEFFVWIPVSQQGSSVSSIVFPVAEQCRVTVPGGHRMSRSCPELELSAQVWVQIQLSCTFLYHLKAFIRCVSSRREKMKRQYKRKIPKTFWHATLFLYSFCCLTPKPATPPSPPKKQTKKTHLGYISLYSQGGTR